MLVRFLCALLFSTFAYASQFEIMNYYTEDYPTYTFKGEDRKVTGFSVELLDNVLNELNVPSQEYRIKMYPWVRAYKQALKNDYPTLLFSTVKTKEREPMFKWSKPIGTTTTSVFTLKNKEIEISDVTDLNAYKIGVIKSDHAEQLLTSEGVSKRKIQVSTNFESILKKLKHGRIDVFVYDETVAKALMNRYNFNPEDFKVVHTLDKAELFFAFNKAVTDETVKQFNQALEYLMQDDDLLASISENYT